METIATDLLDAIKAYSCQLNSTMLAEQIRLMDARDPNSYMGFALLSVISSQVPELSVLLGKKYEEGIVVRKDHDKAMILYQCAAKSGNPSGEYAQGVYYYDREDFVRAIEHFSESLRSKELLTEHELMDAHACLGDAYSFLPSPNIPRAIEYLVIASEKYHSIPATRRLGELYSEAGSPQYDLEKGIQYLRAAVDKGDAFAAHILAQFYLFGSKNGEVEANGILAESVLIPFSGSDDLDIMDDLGVLYFYGDEDRGMEPNYEKAKKYFERVWEKIKDGRVASVLGCINFVLEDYHKAHELLTFADREGKYTFSDFLGRLYLNGYIGPPDIQKAEFYYRHAYEEKSFNNYYTLKEYLLVLIELGKYSEAYEVAEYGIKEYNEIEFVFQKARLVLQEKVTSMDIQEAVAIMDEVRGYEYYLDKASYELGQYFQKVGRYTRAIQYYTMAFDAGMVEAGFCISKIYEHGGGSVQRNIVQANRWYAKAKKAERN